MTRHDVCTFGTLAALLLTAGSSIAAAQASPQGWRGTIAAGNVIEIKGINGAVRAMPSSGGEVEVSAVIKGRRNNPAEVRLEIVQHGEGVTICAMYPSPDSRPNECQPGDGGRMNVQDNDVTVDFTVRVPAGVRFTGRTVNGDVTAERLDGAVAVKTVNGDIEFSTSGPGTASTVNGSIRASLGSTAGNEPLVFKTVNGSVSVVLPADASANLKASTVNGSISTAFPISVSGTVNPRRLNGTIGSGGRELAIETVNGSVTLRKGN
jgi:Putative adhesin